MNDNNANKLILVAAISGFLTVALGAFGAHALAADFSDYQKELFGKAVNYQMFHTLAILACGLLLQHRQVAHLQRSGYLFATGIFFFCGALYLLAITEQHWLGMLAPIGGVSFLAGWVLLVITFWKK